MALNTDLSISRLNLVTVSGLSATTAVPITTFHGQTPAMYSDPLGITLVTSVSTNGAGFASVYLPTGLYFINSNLTAVGYPDIACGGTMTAVHINSEAVTAPSVAAGAGAGGSPTLAITGTDVSGKIALTPGTTPSASGTVATVTFGQAFGAAPKAISLAPGNAATSQLYGLQTVFVPQASITATAFPLSVGASALVSGTAYLWMYEILA